MLVKNHPFIKANPKDTARPYLPITVINPHTNKELNTYALIDTGASDCAFPASYAEPLGHNLERGLVDSYITGNGLTRVHRHTIMIKAFSFTTKDIQVDFFPNLNIPILGVNNFMSNFILTIDYPRKSFSIKIPKLIQTRNRAGNK